MIKPIESIFISNSINSHSDCFHQRASDVRALAERRISFNFDQHNSMGDKSGEYGGKNLF
jgi:hypothetical protein